MHLPPAPSASPRAPHLPFPIPPQGFKRGSEEALTRIDEEVERHARAAFAHAVLQEEGQRGAALEAEAARLGKALYRAPLRPTECAAEEAGVLACDPRTDRRRCQAEREAYEKCAEKLRASLMRPTLR